MRQFFLAITISVSFACAGHAQSGPSYEDTVKFILNKTSTMFGDKTGRSYIREVSKCRFAHYGVTMSKGWEPTKRQSGNRDISANIEEFNAGDLDPSRITFNYDVVLETFENRRSIRRFRINYDLNAIKAAGINPIRGRCPHGDNCKELKPTPSVFVRVFSPINVNGPKVAKAFRHLVKICGGKEELF